MALFQPLTRSDRARRVVLAIGVCAGSLLLLPAASPAQPAQPAGDVRVSQRARPVLGNPAPNTAGARPSDLNSILSAPPVQSVLDTSGGDPAAEPVPTPLGPLRVPLAGQPTAGQIDVRSEHGRVTMIVRDAPLDQVLSALAERQGLNVVFRNDADTRVSLTLTDVPISDALTAILSVVGYRWTFNQGILYVTRTIDGDQLPAHIHGRQTMVFRLDYLASGDILETVEGFLSPTGRAYKLESSTTDNRRTKETLVVEDVPDVLAQVQQYVDRVDQPPRQVLIEAHVLQIDLGDDLQHGVNLDQVMTLAGTPIQLEVTGFANAAAPVAGFLKIDGRDMKGLVECLQTTTDAKTLASPRVLVVDGQEARIQVGSQLGFRVTTTTETSTLESVEFLDLGVVLNVTPRITRDNRVIMRVRPEVSSGQVNPDTGLPEEETTEVETDILLADGEGMVIGGLIQETDTDLMQKLPVLGSIKGLGWLFQSRQRTKDRSEIIIALVPHVLPYTPCLQQRNAEDFMRANTPLLCGPLDKFPRPWEPCLAESQCWPQRLPPIGRFRMGKSAACEAGCQCDACGPPISQSEPVESPAADLETAGMPYRARHAVAAARTAPPPIRWYDLQYPGSETPPTADTYRITRLPPPVRDYRITQQPALGRTLR